MNSLIFIFVLYCRLIKLKTDEEEMIKQLKIESDALAQKKCEKINVSAVYYFRLLFFTKSSHL